MAFDIGTLRAYLTLDNSQYKQATDESIKSTGTLNSGLINLAAGLTVAQQGYNIAATAAKVFIDATTETYASVEEFQRMTGATIEQAGKWHDMLESMGMDLESLTSSYKAFSNNVAMAESNPSSSASIAFEKLGVSIKDTNGDLKNSNDLMLETLTALGKMPDGTAKNALAMDTLGKSYSSLNKLFSEGTDAQKAYNETTTEVTANGKKQFDNYKKSVNAFNASISDLETNIGTKLMPVLTILAKFVNQYLVPVFTTIVDSISAISSTIFDLQLKFVAGVLTMNNVVASTPIGQALGLKTIDTMGYINKIKEDIFGADTGSDIQPPSTSGFENYEEGGTSAIGPSGGYSGGPSGGYGHGGGGYDSRSAVPETLPAGVTRSDLDWAVRRGNISWDQYNNYMSQLPSASPNPYAGNEGYYGAKQYADTGEDISGSITQNYAPLNTPAGELDWGILFNRLQNMEGVSDEVKQLIAERKASMATDSYAAIQKDIAAIEAAGPYGSFGGRSYEEALAYDRSILSSGAAHHDYSWANPSVMGIDQQKMQAEWNRLTTGENATYDSSGNLVVYMMVDGQKVAESVVNKLALLGVNT